MKEQLSFDFVQSATECVRSKTCVYAPVGELTADYITRQFITPKNMGQNTGRLRIYRVVSSFRLNLLEKRIRINVFISELY